MAVRVTSEDANAGFKPTCGSIDELSFRTSPDVWGYFSVKSGGGIHEFSDSQALTLPLTCFASDTCSMGPRLELELLPAGVTGVMQSRSLNLCCRHFGTLRH